MPFRLQLVRFWPSWDASRNRSHRHHWIFVWAHHMYIAGISVETGAYFSAATMVIAVPTSVKVLAEWFLSAKARPWRHPMGMFFFHRIFTFGGITGVILSSVGLSVIFHDTYFVVAHFHYVLSLGAVLCIVIYLSENTHLIGSDFRHSHCVLFYDKLCVSEHDFLYIHVIGFVLGPRRIFWVTCTNRLCWSSHLLALVWLCCQSQHR